MLQDELETKIVIILQNNIQLFIFLSAVVNRLHPHHLHNKK